MQKLSDADPTICPECGAEKVGRQLTAPQFRLAGGGWYETDFKKDGDKKRNLAGEGSSGGSSSASGGDSKPAEKKADSKPEKKPESAPASKPATGGGAA
ncbi:FmdB family zinc ribbon protein [Lysobacter gummosus]|uniref:FmdB family zinc ribbon protein n=1 Tax=Lysobacter gummosus TaxID=262324 RepID=UPI0036417979